VPEPFVLYIKMRNRDRDPESVVRFPSVPTHSHGTEKESEAKRGISWHRDSKIIQELNIHVVWIYARYSHVPNPERNSKGRSNLSEYTGNT
jgi:hypothetical protein